MSSFDTAAIERRTFLLAGLAAVIGATAKEQSPRLETFTQWLDATVSMREQALAGCLDRIRKMDQSIHAWVQVQPEKPTGNGKLSGIPFGVKDIIETRGLSTGRAWPCAAWSGIHRRSKNERTLDIFGYSCHYDSHPSYQWVAPGTTNHRRVRAGCPSA